MMGLTLTALSHAGECSGRYPGRVRCAPIVLDALAAFSMTASGAARIVYLSAVRTPEKN